MYSCDECRQPSSIAKDKTKESTINCKEKKKDDWPAGRSIRKQIANCFISLKIETIAH